MKKVGSSGKTALREHSIRVYALVGKKAGLGHKKRVRSEVTIFG
jgi:hypothetical protein